MADHAFAELRSPRLILRRLQRADLRALCEYRSLPAVARFQSWESFGPDDAARLIDGQCGLEPNVPGTWFQLAIVAAAAGVMVGDCGLHFRQDDPRQMEIGITLAPSHQGRGYATETLGLVLDYLFVRLDKHRVTAITDADNDAAAELLRRLGFRREGHFIENIRFKGKWGSEFSFALLQREWERHRSFDRVPVRPCRE